MGVDASETGVGAVLSQCFGEKPKLDQAALYFPKLTLAEQIYDFGNTVLLTIKLAVEEWLQWMEGAAHAFVIFIDHNKHIR